MAEMSAEKAEERIKKIHYSMRLPTLEPEDYEALALSESTLRKVASGELREVVHASWREYTGEDKGFHFCSACEGQAFNYDEGSEPIEILSNYCPSCGALMEDSHE